MLKLTQATEFIDLSKPNPSLELNIQYQKGYQHHGLLCFFFLRPILLTKGLEVDQEIMKSSQVTTMKVPTCSINSYFNFTTEITKSQALTEEHYFNLK